MRLLMIGVLKHETPGSQAFKKDLVIAEKEQGIGERCDGHLIFRQKGSAFLAVYREKGFS